jgi:hypothetical protein
VVSRELTTRSDPLAFIANADTDTELWVYRNKEERDLVFAFRHGRHLTLSTCDAFCQDYPFACSRSRADKPCNLRDWSEACSAAPDQAWMNRKQLQLLTASFSTYPFSLGAGAHPRQRT